MVLIIGYQRCKSEAAAYESLLNYKYTLEMKKKKPNENCFLVFAYNVIVVLSML